MNIVFSQRFNRQGLGAEDMPVSDTSCSIIFISEEIHSITPASSPNLGAFTKSFGYMFLFKTRMLG